MEKTRIYGCSLRGRCHPKPIPLLVTLCLIASAAAYPSSYYDYFYVLEPLPTPLDPCVRIQTLDPRCQPVLTSFCHANVTSTLSLEPVTAEGEYTRYEGCVQESCSFESEWELELVCKGLPNTLRVFGFHSADNKCTTTHLEYRLLEETCFMARTWFRLPYQAWIVPPILEEMRLVANGSVWIHHLHKKEWNQTLLYTVFPTREGCSSHVIRFSSPPSHLSESECVRRPPPPPKQFEIDWGEVDAAWIGFMWLFVTFIYVHGLLGGLFNRYGRLFTLSHTLLLVCHIPVLETLAFSSYFVYTLLGMHLPFVARGIGTAWTAWQKGLDRLRVPSSEAIQNGGRALLFLSMQWVVLIVMTTGRS